MALVDKLPNETLEVPGEPGNHFTFRGLSADELDDVQAASARDMVDRYGAKTMEALGSMQRPTSGPAAEAIREVEEAVGGDPLAGYSDRALVEYGLVSWTGPGYGDVACDEATKKRLTPRVRRWAAEQVFALTEITSGEVKSSVNGSDGGRAVSAATAAEASRGD